VEHNTQGTQAMIKEIKFVKYELSIWDVRVDWQEREYIKTTFTDIVEAKQAFTKATLDPSNKYYAIRLYGIDDRERLQLQKMHNPSPKNNQ